MRAEERRHMLFVACTKGAGFLLFPPPSERRVSMGAQDNGLSLEGLAQRLEVLERENAELRNEVSALRGSDTRRGKVAALRGSDTHQSEEGEAAPEFEGQVSRRTLLSKAGAAAVAAMAAGTLMYPRQAKAHHWDPGIQVNFVDTHDVVIATVGPGHALQAFSNSGSLATVFGSNGQSRGTAVEGKAWTGVFGNSGASDGTGYPEGVGVRGIAKDGTGVWGSSSKTGYSGVYGQHTGTAGYGLAGDGTGNGAGVLGRNPNGPGVEARDSVYGGKFAGSRAQLLLVPKGAAGKPTTGAHTKGEIYMDSTGALFVCTANGTPGTWRKVTTTAA
jgi:hypothetical protein